MLQHLAINGQYPVSLFIALFIELAMLIATLLRAKPTVTNRVFNFIVFIALWVNVAEIAQLYVKSEAMFRYLAVYITLSNNIIMTPILLVFILLLVGKRTLVMSRRFLIPLSVWLLIITPMLGTTLLYNFDRSHAHLVNWLYQYQAGPLVWLIQIVALALLAIVILLWRARSKAISENQKRQFTVIAAGFLVIFVALALLKNQSHPLLAVPANLGIIYAILRYGFLSTDSASIGAEVVNIMQGAVLGLSPKGELIYINEHGKELLGAREKDLYNTKIQHFISAHGYEGFKTHVLARLHKGEKVSGYETTLITADGKKLVVNINATPQMDKRGMDTAILVLYDITDLKQTQLALEREKDSVEKKVVQRTKELHKEQAKLHASIESLSAGFMLVETNGRISIQNTALQTIFDLDYGVTSMSDLTAVMQGFDLAVIIDKVQTKRKAIEVHEVNVGSKILHLFAAPVVADDAGSTMGIGTLILFEDITEQKIHDRSKDEFFSIASHELRTPLTAIKGNASMALEFYAQVFKDHDLREMIEDIHSASVRLIDIVNDFLDLSRLEQGKMSFQYEAFQLDKIVESVVYEMKIVLNEKKLDLKFNRMTLGSLPDVWADKSRVKQIIYNLVGNAAKFTETGGITLDVEATKTAVKVMIHDTGRGIAQEEQNLLFRKFQQAGESLLTRDTTSGTGLGLYISKVMLEEMGGKIALESSEIGKGSTFSFTIPIATPALIKKAANAPAAKIDTGSGITMKELSASAVESHDSAAPTGIKSQGHLLIIEDDPYVIRLYERLFRFKNYSIHVATNGKDGLSKAAELKPKLILLDIMMPTMNGLQVLEKLKADASTKHIPVVIVSSADEGGLVDEAKRLGADDYMIKSDFTPEELFTRVQHYLQ